MYVHLLARTMSTNQKRTNILLTVQQRLDILQQLENGVPIMQLANDYGVHLQTIRRIRAKGDQLQQGAMCLGFENRKRIRKPKLDELDNRLYTWFLEQSVNGTDGRITDMILKKKANELNAKFGGPSTFSASNGWIWRFKKRHGIQLVKSYDVPSNNNIESDEELVEDFLQRVKDEDIDSSHIYKMDETNLLWKALPDRMLIRSIEKRIYESKTKEDRVTVGLCANASGTHKLPPLFVHRYEKPKALKHVRQHELPVVYKAQRQALMDHNVFADWLENHFKPAVRTYQMENGSRGRTLLLMNNCNTRILTSNKLNHDDNFDIVYLPRNTSVAFESRDQGVITKLKRSFRRRMLEKVLDYPRGVIEFYMDYDIKDCVDLLKEAWDDVLPFDIRLSCKRFLGRNVIEKEGIKQEPEEDHVSGIPNVTRIAETVGTIIQQTVSDDEIQEWLSICEQIENEGRHIENETIKDDAMMVSKPLLDEEESERTFTNLLLWAESESPCVRLQVSTLKIYYEQVYLKKLKKLS